MAENFINHLSKLLKADNRLVDEEKDIQINVLRDLVNNLDSQLIELLIADEKVREKFFIKVKDVYVFKQNDFIFYLDSKVLDGSYTQYANRIGLASGGKFLTDSTDYVLDFPYKDCLLEGGQSTEEGNDVYFEYDEGANDYVEKSAKRKEIFYNNIIAKDEIDRLLEPKAFQKVVRYDANGEGTPTSFNRDAELNRQRGLPEDTITDNLIIKGNNLLALHSLEKEFKGKVKLIYIDPPYNTGNDGFNYNDTFTHSAWLTFMYNRLLVSKSLLKDDGLIIVQIDSSRNNKNNRVGTSELPYLSILMDLIFNRSNFIGHLHWKKKKQPSFLSKIAGVMESILIYSKNESLVPKIQIGNISDKTTRVDNSDNKVSEYLLPANIRCKSISNGVIKKGIYTNKTLSTEYLDDITVEKGRTKNEVRVKAKFRTTEAEILRFATEDLIFITENNSLRRDKSEIELTKGKTITDLLLDWGQNQDATDELRKLFNIKDDSKPFETPKPELLLHNLIISCTSKNDIILDYFLGSATTIAVAHKTERQYIGIEQMDYINDICMPRMKKVLEGEQGGVSIQAQWQGGGSFVYAELAKNNETAKERIAACNSLEDLLQLFEELNTRYFLDYNVRIKDFKENVIKEEAFVNLSLARQKEIFKRMLDNNHLYVNLSEVEDARYNLSEDAIRLTKDFYQIKN